MVGISAAMRSRRSFRTFLFLQTLATCLCTAVASSSDLIPRELIGTEEDEAVAEFPGSQFHNFRSRPDIKAPRFKVDFYDKEALAPGYWFVAPYANLDQKSNAKSWVGPYIYDNNGEVVWCGAELFKHYNTYDFMRTRVDGEDMLALKYPHGDSGVIFDNTYQIRREVTMNIDNPSKRDMHEFNLIEDGSRALVVTSTEHRSTVAQAKAIGIKDGQTCKSLWKGFKELDTVTSKPVFEWDARDHLGLDEVTKLTGPYEKLCHRNWDILHINAVDKFPDGDYLVSARHTDTIYKVNHTDGSIVWRLGGIKSDYTLESEWARFSRQHHATVRGQNETHTMIGLFDNAKGNGQNETASHPNSRGLLLALDNNSKMATIAAEYDHPNGGITNSRGSFQTLPNGNAFMGWTYHTLLSEHAPDGRLLMQATLKLPGHCYRNYKFPWVGNPVHPPDVFSAGYTGTMKNGTDALRTVIWVSWNGATEVAAWEVYRSDISGNMTEPIAFAPRQGFETVLGFEGFASHVVVEAFDRKGKSLGKSNVVKTVAPPDLNKASKAYFEDSQWLQHHMESDEIPHNNVGQNISSFRDKAMSLVDEPIALFFGGCITSILLATIFFGLWRCGPRSMCSCLQRSRGAYKPLGHSEDVDAEVVEKKRESDDEMWSADVK